MNQRGRLFEPRRGRSGQTPPVEATGSYIASSIVKNAASSLDFLSVAEIDSSLLINPRNNSVNEVNTAASETQPSSFNFDSEFGDSSYLLAALEEVGPPSNKKRPTAPDASPPKRHSKLAKTASPQKPHIRTRSGIQAAAEKHPPALQLRAGSPFESQQGSISAGHETVSQHAPSPPANTFLPPKQGATKESPSTAPTPTSDELRARVEDLSKRLRASKKDAAQLKLKLRATERAQNSKDGAISLLRHTRERLERENTKLIQEKQKVEKALAQAQKGFREELQRSTTVLTAEREAREQDYVEVNALRDRAERSLQEANTKITQLQIALTQAQKQLAVSTRSPSASQPSINHVASAPTDEDMEMDRDLLRATLKARHTPKSAKSARNLTPKKVRAVPIELSPPAASSSRHAQQALSQPSPGVPSETFKQAPPFRLNAEETNTLFSVIQSLSEVRRLRPQEGQSTDSKRRKTESTPDRVASLLQRYHAIDHSLQECVSRLSLQLLDPCHVMRILHQLLEAAAQHLEQLLTSLPDDLKKEAIIDTFSNLIEASLFLLFSLLHRCPRCCTEALSDVHYSSGSVTHEITAPYEYTFHSSFTKVFAELSVEERDGLDLSRILQPRDPLIRNADGTVEEAPPATATVSVPVMARMDASSSRDQLIGVLIWVTKLCHVQSLRKRALVFALRALYILARASPLHILPRFLHLLAPLGTQRSVHPAAHGLLPAILIRPSPSQLDRQSKTDETEIRALCMFLLTILVRIPHAAGLLNRFLDNTRKRNKQNAHGITLMDVLLSYLGTQHSQSDKRTTLVMKLASVRILMFVATEHGEEGLDMIYCPPDTREPYSAAFAKSRDGVSCSKSPRKRGRSPYKSPSKQTQDRTERRIIARFVRVLSENVVDLECQRQTPTYRVTLKLNRGGRGGGGPNLQDSQSMDRLYVAHFDELRDILQHNLGAEEKRARHIVDSFEKCAGCNALSHNDAALLERSIVIAAERQRLQVALIRETFLAMYGLLRFGDVHFQLLDTDSRPVAFATLNRLILGAVHPDLADLSDRALEMRKYLLEVAFDEEEADKDLDDGAAYDGEAIPLDLSDDHKSADIEPAVTGSQAV